MGEELKKKLFNVKKDGWEEADEADFKHFFIDKNFVSIQNA